MNHHWHFFYLDFENRKVILLGDQVSWCSFPLNLFSETYDMSKSCFHNEMGHLRHLSCASEKIKPS